MADIVEMLRTPAGAHPPTKWELAAADEIERLRKALEKIVEQHPMTLDQWIEREFAGYGLAMRRESDPPIPGEPFMSMKEAKELTRRAVAFALSTVTNGE